MSGAREVTATLHTRNAWILGIALLGALPFGGRAVASVALGGAVQIVNLRLLERSVGGMLRGAGLTGPGRGLQALLVLRLLLLLGVVATLMLTVPLEPIAFTLGLSSAVPACLWHGLATRHPEV